MIVGQVGLDNDQITIIGPKTILEHALYRAIGHLPDWCPVLTGNGARRGLENLPQIIVLF